jgi:hypothetical protein
MHSTSNLCNSVNMYIFRRLMPAMLMLPMFMPEFSHLFSLSTFCFLCLAEPLVRFLFLCHYYFLCATWLFPCSLSDFSHSLSSILFTSLFIIITFPAALAQWGAIPFPTPAGLWPGGYRSVEFLGMVGGW